MSFFDKFTKGVGKAAEQAKFEADKLMRANRIGSEVSQLATEAEQATAAIGKKVMELRAAGGFQAPELDEMIQRVEALRAKVAAKEAELEAVKAEKFEMPAPAPSVVVPPATVMPPPPSTPWAGGAPPVAETTPPAAEAAPAARACPACGTAVEPGTKFCPSCGQKLG